ncbi:hypothetical protein PUN28_001659 [Cardiocondyla obscurior]|uniref:Uncharacterized protein n=1 Tax=Cardiocondyla obscurior TaxID=286306 RepID=A0AAW2GQM2_9HYME
MEMMMLGVLRISNITGISKSAGDRVDSLRPIVIKFVVRRDEAEEPPLKVDILNRMKTQTIPAGVSTAERRRRPRKGIGHRRSNPVVRINFLLPLPFLKLQKCCDHLNAPPLHP